MTYQLRGLQASFLIHAILITLIVLLIRSVTQPPKPIMLDFSIIREIAAGDCAVNKEMVPAARKAAAPQKTITKPAVAQTRQEQPVTQEPIRSVPLPTPSQPEQIFAPVRRLFNQWLAQSQLRHRPRHTIQPGSQGLPLPVAALLQGQTGRMLEHVWVRQTAQSSLVLRQGLLS